MILGSYPTSVSLHFHDYKMGLIFDPFAGSNKMSERVSHLVLVIEQVLKQQELRLVLNLPLTVSVLAVLSPSLDRST